MRANSSACKQTVRLMLLLAAAAPGLSQGESEPYFEISTNRTFGTNGRPTVEMSAWNVDALEFRIYRVHDPVKFFQDLEDSHQFGGRVAAPPRQRTLIERIHSWKRGLRAGIRRSLRAQFTEPPSNHFSVLKPAEVKLPPGKETRYAEAPVLNPDQLVATFQQPVSTHSRWDRETVPIGVKEKGIYLVEAVRKDYRAYTILMVSDTVLITKTGKGRIVNMLIDRTTGEPVRGAKVWALTRDGKPTEAETNGEGIAELPSATRPQDLRVLARRGDDYSVNSLGEYSFSINRPQWMGYVYTDRPVYRPGHTVHFKAIARMRTATGFDVPAGKAINVTINDAEQKPVYQKTLTTSATGTIHDDLTLAASASLGNYYIEMKVDEGFMNGNFEVQEYKKPEYEVRVTPAKTRVLQGDTIQATIDARYYFGEPVNGAKVTYGIYREHYYFPLWYDPEESNVIPGQPPDDDSDVVADQVGEQEGQLDADGKLNIQIETKTLESKRDYMYRIEARVTDEAKREITGRGYVLATYGSFLVNPVPESYLVNPGSQAAVTVQARDYDLKPVSTKAHVQLFEATWKDGEFQWIPRTATDVQTGADGDAKAMLNMPSTGGTYKVEVTARTPEGRDISGDSYLWAPGGKEFDTGPETEKRIQLITDKKTYAAGETAKVLILSGKPNVPVYVTVEGRDLRQIKLIRAAGTSATFEVPVAAQDEPGFTVSAGFVNKGVFYTGDKHVRVPPVSHQLNVKVTTDKPQYQPGQTAEYSLDVTGSDGKPVPKAEFSLGVVDEAIYAIRKDTTPEILNFFFGNDFNTVSTSSSLEYYFSGEAGKRRMRLAELRPASRLAQLKPDRLVQPKVRKAFPDTAFWATDLVTDANGHARAKVDFPDSLTTWRATARGATPDTKVGATISKTIVRKNLILRLAVPRFFVQGDEVTISALVHNYLATDKTARVSLDVKGLDILEGTTKDVPVPSRGEAKVEWRVRAQQVRSATVTGKALTDEESDALELDLPVNVPGVKLSQSRGGSIPAGVGADFDLTYPANVEPGSRSMSIRVSPSIAGSLFGALEYLTGFPYGCVEQTMSSFLPNIIVRQAVRDLGLNVSLDDAALQQKIRAGLDRLYGFQHEDGGWGWWQTDDTHPFMTAYVVAGLAQAKAAGMQVNDDAIQNGAKWLKKNFAADTTLAGDLRAYEAYALMVAGQGDTASLGQVYTQRSTLSPYGLALLGLAMEQAKDGRAAEIAGSLEQGAKSDAEQAWWPSTRDQLLDFSEDATPEATAFVVKFLSHERKDSPLLPKAALWLMNHRNEGYWWNSTKQTAMVIYGLTDYLKATNELNPNLSVTVFVNDTQVLSRKLDQDTAIGAPELLLDESKLKPGFNHVRITTSGAGRLYYSGRAEYYSTDEKLQKNGTISLNILRDYFKLVPGKDGEKIVYDLAPLNGPVQTGDTLAVRLTVTGSDWKYMMAEDPIPAGTEFIERDNGYEIRQKPGWWDYYFTRRELHDDRVALFETHFAQGQHTFFYLLKAVNPGVFKVSPARVGPMYQRDVMATTESRRLEVK